jgi:toxin ParE1/3/4
MAKVELSEAADRDLTEIYLYSFQQFGEQQADAYLLSLDDCLCRLAETPGLGRSIEALHPGAFRFEHDSHTVFFRRIDGGIRVIRVLHRRMDPERHL